MIRTFAVRLSAALLLIASIAMPAAAADEALSLVPANAVSVGMIRFSDMRSSPLSSLLFEQTDKMSSDGEAQKFLRDAGLSLTKDIDVLVVATSPRTALGSEADVVVLAEGRYNVERLTSALVSRGAVRKNGYFMLPEEDEPDHAPAIAFASSSLIIGGSETAVSAALAARKSGGTGFVTRGGLGMDLARIESGATAWALVDVTRAARLAKRGTIDTGKGQPGEALQSALRSLSTVAVWATDKGDALALGALGLSADAETLELLEDTIRGGLSAMRLAAKDKAPEMVPVLRRFDVARANGGVTVTGSIPADQLKKMMDKKKMAMK
jgi:hypothetical protein